MKWSVKIIDDSLRYIRVEKPALYRPIIYSVAVRKSITLHEFRGMILHCMNMIGSEK